ncbi:MAG: iron ABC transporter substrate-binding protein [Ilumatobacteraceae bacterium]
MKTGIARRRAWRALGAALAMTTVTALAACGGSSDTTSDTASDTSVADEAPVIEGTSITVYSGRSETLVQPLIDEFTAATGVTVEVRYGDSGELAALLLTEGDASPADVYFGQDAGALGAIEDAGLFATLPETTLSLVDPAFRSVNDGWVGTSGRARVIVYNPELVPTLPTSLDDLLNVQWKGKIGFAPTNASWQSFVTALRVTRGEDGAEAWLTGFAANEPVAYEKNGVVRDAVNTGEVAMGLINHYYLYEKISKEGANAVVAKNHYLRDGDAGSLVNVAGAGILATSANPAGAQAFIDYMLSQGGQEYFANTTFEYPLVAGVPTSVEIPALSELNAPAIDLADLKSLEATQELLVRVGLLTK